MIMLDLNRFVGSELPDPTLYPERITTILTNEQAELLSSMLPNMDVRLSLSPSLYVEDVNAHVCSMLRHTGEVTIELWMTNLRDFKTLFVALKAAPIASNP
ncbi:hypothetical protein [Terasakiella sp.]|uniref:hypothetical protein n=1 Tax=Terasakiella sp. TaxID=2034861 RepID=UPI003AA89879